MVEPGPEFRPPHCPRPSCRYHQNPRGWRFKRDGHHHRRCHPAPVQRYRCLHCRRSFSSQTFSTTYWLKRPDLLERVLQFLLCCGGFRQAARMLGVSPATPALHAERLGRHMLLFAEQHRPRTIPSEPLVVDGFESFAFSQFWPTHLNLVVGARSHFVYATTVAELRRKGRMTEGQKKRRERLEKTYGRPDPKAIEKGVAEALRLAVPRGARAVVRSDEHPAYPRALRRVSDRELTQETTSSRVSRTPRNPLFAVNLLDLLLRHSGSNHKRETIAFSKRAQSMLWREALFRVWRNWVKHVSERARKDTPAMRLRLADRPLRWGEILRQRIFVTRTRLRAPLDTYYWGRVPTRQIPRAREHRRVFAF